MAPDAYIGKAMSRRREPFPIELPRQHPSRYGLLASLALHLGLALLFIIGGRSLASGNFPVSHLSFDQGAQLPLCCWIHDFVLLGSFWLGSMVPDRCAAAGERRRHIGPARGQRGFSTLIVGPELNPITSYPGGIDGAFRKTVTTSS